jgi:hypothetical protein
LIEDCGETGGRRGRRYIFYFLAIFDKKWESKEYPKFWYPKISIEQKFKFCICFIRKQTFSFLGEQILIEYEKKSSLNLNMV